MTPPDCINGNTGRMPPLHFETGAAEAVRCDDAVRRRIGAYYAAAALAALLAILHFSVVALVLSLVLWVRLGRRVPPSSPCGQMARSHRRWLRRTLAAPLGLYGALLVLVTYEAVSMVGDLNGGRLLQAVAGHMVLHSAVTLLSGLWLVVRLLLGGLRFIDGRPA